MTSKERKLSCNHRLELLVAFFNNVDQDARWWCNAGTSSGNEDEEFNCLLPPLSEIFGAREGTAGAFLVEASYLKKKGNACINNSEGCDFSMSVVGTSNNVETTMTRLSKAGGAPLAPAATWDDYLEHPRQAHPNQDST